MVLILKVHSLTQMVTLHILQLFLVVETKLLKLNGCRKSFNAKNKQSVYAGHPLITHFTQIKNLCYQFIYYEPFGKLFVNGKKQLDFPCLKS